MPKGRDINPIGILPDIVSIEPKTSNTATRRPTRKLQSAITYLQGKIAAAPRGRGSSFSLGTTAMAGISGAIKSRHRHCGCFHRSIFTNPSAQLQLVGTTKSEYLSQYSHQIPR